MIHKNNFTSLSDVMLQAVKVAKRWPTGYWVCVRLRDAIVKNKIKVSE